MKIGITTAILAILAVYTASLPGKATILYPMSKMPETVTSPLYLVGHCKNHDNRIGIAAKCDPQILAECGPKVAGPRWKECQTEILRECKRQLCRG